MDMFLAITGVFLVVICIFLIADGIAEVMSKNTNNEK